MFAIENKWFWLSLTIVIGILIYLLTPVLTPFVIAAILAYVGDPLVDKLETYKIPRTLAVSIVFVVLTLFAATALIILVPMLERQIMVLGQKIPGYIEVIQTQFLPWVNERFGMSLKIEPEEIKQAIESHWQSAGSVASTALSYVTKSGAIIASFFANLLLIPVVTFYMLRDWDVMVAQVRTLLPRKTEPVISHLAKQSDEVLGAFLRGQVLVMLALSVIYSVGLGIVGLELALLIGVVAGLVSFVPYLGFIVGIIVASIAALMQFGDATYLFYVAIVFGIGQAIEGMVLTPLLVGDRIGLHPVAVIFAVLAGGQLFGFLGVLLALPIAAVLAVFVRYLHEQYKASKVYSG